MIFAIVGTQAPFDRMIEILDNWAADNPETEIIAQIGNSELSPKNLKCYNYISPVEFNAIFDKADLIVGHAGMGTIITALQSEKPIITMARLKKFNEHRNDHQVHTANSFHKLGYIQHAKSEDELLNLLNNSSNIKPAAKIGKFASLQLIKELKQQFTAE